MRRVFGVSIVVTVVVGLACGAVAERGRHAGGLPAGVRVDRLVVYKGEHRLEAYARETLLRTYDIAIGAGGVR